MYLLYVWNNLNNPLRSLYKLFVFDFARGEKRKVFLRAFKSALGIFLRVVGAKREGARVWKIRGYYRALKICQLNTHNV